ncbi:DUF262 domain-containing protein [Erythrobacter sp.]|uniref:DUF262 domain-containing protein n=1 Tax=Erythrobacter sp. TaxID=1042 RepID=UPI001B1DFD02|nr:DUF262 domain-containing protein [Erythrobacter sp.]MBO6528397.1 DUF262 domain-containing protein [Erythrobacter sp.]MBO6531300.1 DUF262 domain-containing protein [Erythrobacter sp.]
MGTWNSSPHPISDLRDWSISGRLELRPSFQRKEVWNPAARIMLIDTILREVPMPKMFLWNEIRNEQTYRQVIDGQQRISAILAFLRDEFALDEPYSGEFAGKKFSELPVKVRNRILQYKIDYNEAIGFSEEEVREVYSRVNKYSLPLNKQELRRADFPGRFLELATELSLDEYLDEARVFTVGQRRRMGDVEFVSEILAGMLEGPQDKKGELDYFYARYAAWKKEEEDAAKTAFLAVLADFKRIFAPDRFPLARTRFKQKSDFYSLFLSIHEFHRGGYGIADVELEPLRGDIRLLDENIAPESEIDILSEYAIKCVSQANTIASRSWRKNFLMDILSGTYRKRRPDGAVRERFEEMALQLDFSANGKLFDHCAACGKPPHDHRDERRVLDWPAGAPVYQLSNACWRFLDCEEAE